MGRVSATEVKQIITTTMTDADVDVFIAAANRLVTDLIGSSTELSDAQRKDIEWWVTAHLIASTREHQPQAEGAGDAKITYQGSTAMGLDSTYYGQTAQVLDTTGIMAAKLGKQAIAITAVTSPERADWG